MDKRRIISLYVPDRKLIREIDRLVERERKHRNDPWFSRSKLIREMIRKGVEGKINR